MDRRRPLARLLSSTPLLLLGAAADVPNLPISEARWLAPEHLVEGLTTQPRECLARPRTRQERESVAIGRAAFRAPLLLGGQAARAGLSCASCHRNGRGNPHFTFPGLSGHPGTADITSSLMSSRRGDGTANPKPIPDLAARAPKHIVSRGRDTDALEQFIRGLVVEEFDGPEPPAAALQGLADYVRAISPCPGQERITLKSRLGEAEAALGAAELAVRRRDKASARLLLGAARSALGSIDERFRLPGLEESRRTLRDADSELGDLQHAIDSGADALRPLRSWRSKWSERRAALLRVESRSLFSRAVLKRRLIG